MKRRGIPVKGEEQIARMRKVCGMTATVRQALLDMVEPGIMTNEIEAEALRMIEGYGAISAFKGYHGFPGQVCISLNDEVVHGIPGERIIQRGDVVSIDQGLIFDGHVGDCAGSVIAGGGGPEGTKRLLEATQAALAAGISFAVEGARLGDISHAVQETAEGAGYSVVREFVGHGIGTEMHEEPQIPNYGPPGTGPKLKYGMIFAIEPMINMGDAAVEVMEDNWTVRTQDRKPSAHFENTVLVGKGGAEILTNPEYAGK